MPASLSTVLSFLCHVLSPTRPCPVCHGEGDRWVDASTPVREVDAQTREAYWEMEVAQNLEPCPTCGGRGRVRV